MSRETSEIDTPIPRELKRQLKAMLALQERSLKEWMIEKVEEELEKQSGDSRFALNSYNARR